MKYNLQRGDLTLEEFYTFVTTYFKHYNYTDSNFLKKVFLQKKRKRVIIDVENHQFFFEEVSMITNCDITIEELMQLWG